MSNPGNKSADGEGAGTGAAHRPDPGGRSGDELALGETIARSNERDPTSVTRPVPGLALGRPVPFGSTDHAGSPGSASSTSARQTPPSAGSPQSQGSYSGPLPPEIISALRQSLKPRMVDDELPRGGTIGRYVVLSCLGAGGMGVVYAAYDPELDRKVAIKLLRAGAGGHGASGRMRLMREAQAMARLQHPQVIAVYDVGTLAEQVFIAMEFIDGGTLTSWLTEQPRTPRQIIEVFVLAGRGLAAAHTAGLIHRDFKPDNVLIAKDGQVRVMDFGLARSVGQTQHEDPQATPPDGSSADPADARYPESPSSSQVLKVQLTRTGALMGTPRYMSPEQYEMRPTDPRTDQFSFCVALFEALYGFPPFAGDNLTTLGFNVVRGKVQSVPPDTKVPAWVLKVLLRGLSVNADDRYPDMAALLQALSRERRKGSRLWAVGVLVGAIALLGNLGYHLVQQRKDSLCHGAERKLTGIWDEPRKAALGKALLSTGKSYAPDVWTRVQAALDTYAQEWVAMRTDSCRATARGFQSQEVSDLRVRCLDERLGEFDALARILSKADEAVLEQASSAAHELPPIADCADVEALNQPMPLPADPDRRARVNKLSAELAELRALERIGKYADVLDRARQAARLAAELKYRPLESEALYVYGNLQQRGGLAKQAEQSLIRAAAAAIESRQQRLLAQTWILLTTTTGVRLREADKADVWAQLAGAALDNLPEADADPLRAQLDNALCNIASWRRQWDAAIGACKNALTLRTKLFGAGSSDVAEVLHTLATVYRRQEKFDLALDYYQKALAIETSVLGTLHPSVASALRGIGIVMRDQRKYREALDRFQQALDIMQRSLGPMHIRTSDFELLVAITQMYLGELGEAQRHFERCVQISEQAREDDTNDSRRSEAYWFLGEVLAQQGRHEEALEKHRIGLRLREQSPERKEELVAYSLCSLGEDLFALGRSREALPYLERALSIRQNRTTEPNRLGRSEFALARVLWSLGRPEQKQRAIELALEARTAYVEWGNRPENELAAVQAWLDANTPPAPVAKPRRR